VYNDEEEEEEEEEEEGSDDSGEIALGAKRRADNDIASGENRTRSYFRRRRAVPITTAIILTHRPNPFRDSLRSSQTKTLVVIITTIATRTTLTATPTGLVRSAASTA